MFIHCDPLEAVVGIAGKSVVTCAPHCKVEVVRGSIPLLAVFPLHGRISGLEVTTTFRLARDVRRSPSKAVADLESFFSTLKTELAGATRYPTRAVARAAIFEYVVTWYNRKRRHSALGYQTPAQAASGELAA
jgi:Integrase core domain